jgi:hypothetical protein
MAFSRRWMLPTFNVLAHSAMKVATVSGLAGTAHN